MGARINSQAVGLDFESAAWFFRDYHKIHFIPIFEIQILEKNSLTPWELNSLVDSQFAVVMQGAIVAASSKNRDFFYF